MILRGKIESLLLASPRPLTVRRLAELLKSETAEVESALADLAEKWNEDDSGIHVLRHGAQVQLVTSPLNSKIITDFLKEEQAGELTRPALETLTIIAYRGPISKIQLDTIRGVNCALILRNLMIKGLVEAKQHKDKLQSTYQVTLDFMRFLGLSHVRELPDYEQLNRDENLQHLLNPVVPVVVTEENHQLAESTAGNLPTESS